jgi:hypothetical protein
MFTRSAEQAWRPIVVARDNYGAFRTLGYDAAKILRGLVGIVHNHEPLLANLCPAPEPQKY